MKRRRSSLESRFIDLVRPNESKYSYCMDVLLHVCIMAITIIGIYFLVNTEKEENTIEMPTTRVAHKPTMNVIKQQMAKIAKIRLAKFGP